MHVNIHTNLAPALFDFIQIWNISAEFSKTFIENIQAVTELYYASRTSDRHGEVVGSFFALLFADYPNKRNFCYRLFHWAVVENVAPCV
jgi:hypothetical protein